ncbi:MAG: bifunctional riboflavin kinase/FAD synthetase [Candidatus Latescibacteria bacterium]|nr:bifunctional riboflavin kinase/FAD synthetase [Candidatus Latescibacterota bacterium]
MEVIETCNTTLTFPWPVVTVGMFDGVHLGHRAILQEVLQRSETHGGTSLVVTFEPHPRRILHPDVDLRLLTTKREKLIWLERLGIAVVLLLPFTRKLADTPPDRFVEEILLGKCGAKEVIIGYNHRFGKDRAGSFDLLQRFSLGRGFFVNPVPRVMVDGCPVSSTRIREALTAGDIALATQFLGHDYTIVGIVVRGDGRGKTLGFPTINIAADLEKLLPKDGVYAVWVRHLTGCTSGEVSPGVMNTGTRPTVDGKRRSLECHLLDFEGDVYGVEMEVVLVERLRDERKFNHVQDLIIQIEKDTNVARHILRESPPATIDPSLHRTDPPPSAGRQHDG